jgi:predicted Kef-type K+ transport protein
MRHVVMLIVGVILSLISMCFLEGVLAATVSPGFYNFGLLLGAFTTGFAVYRITRKYPDTQPEKQSIAH